MGRVTEKGFSSAEIAVALAVVALVTLTAIPSFTSMLRRSRVSGASRQIISDIREARSRSLGSGWEYKLFGFAATSTDTRKNQYRVLARANSGVSWPSDTSAVMSSTTQRAGAWVNVATSFPGVNLVSPTARFEIAFDSRGSAPAASSFNPLVVNNQWGTSSSITVTTTGGVRVQ